MSDEDRWQVLANRRAPLAGHSTQVRNNGRDDAILYYPGSGSDILHPLFASGEKARYFIFVDPLDLDQSLPAHIKEKHSRLNGTEARNITTNLGIRSQPTGAWMFSMQRRTRYLFHFRMGHDPFVAANRSFVCDILFDKDFWETSADIDLSDVLALLRIGGHYSTNASIGGLANALELVGLSYVGTYQINGDQYLYRRRTRTNLTWATLKAAIDSSVRFIQDLVNDEDNPLSYNGPYDRDAIAAELVQRRAAILAPFLARGINVPQVLRNPLCRELALKAVGAAIGLYAGGIRDAFS